MPIGGKLKLKGEPAAPDRWPHTIEPLNALNDGLAQMQSQQTNPRNCRKAAGGQTLGIKKRKKHKAKPAEEGAEGATDPAADPGTAASGDAPGGIPTQVKTGQAYEAEFATEVERAKEGKAKTTPWGSGFAKAPEILHGVQNLCFDMQHRPDFGSAYPDILTSEAGSLKAWEFAWSYGQRMVSAQVLFVPECVFCICVNLRHAVVHAGYNRKVLGKTPEERLDLRCARKTDKFCK